MSRLRGSAQKTGIFNWLVFLVSISILHTGIHLRVYSVFLACVKLNSAQTLMVVCLWNSSNA